MKRSTKILPSIGLIGAGTMGTPIARNLLQAKYVLSVFDTNPQRARDLEEEGGIPAATPSSLAAAAEIILLCLPASDKFLEFVQQQLLPGLTAGKMLVDLGTTSVVETRRMAQWLQARNIKFLDAPVSGGERAARKRTLSMFVGGRKEYFDRCMPVLNVLAGDGSISYCGPAGNGQIVNGVSQLAMALGSAAFLEAIAYGAAQGVPPEELAQVLEKSAASATSINQVLRRLIRDGGESIETKYPMLPGFVQNAEAHEQALPLTQAICGFLSEAPAAIIEQGHHVPSFWNELKRRPK